MLNDFDRLGLTDKDFELIEGALHTQKKILTVQSEAGGAGARQKLNELKRLTQRIGRARSPMPGNAPLSLTQFALSFLRPQGGTSPLR